MATSSSRWQESMYNLDMAEKGGEATHADFADRTLRAGFMRKVFGLLAMQLAITTVIGAVCVLSSTVSTFLVTTPIIPIVAMMASMGILLAFTFSESARTSHPTNLILLTAFTVFEGCTAWPSMNRFTSLTIPVTVIALQVLVGMACARYPADLVLTAFALTVAVSSGLALYALRTKTDFTAMGGCLYAMLMAFVTCILLQMVFHVPIASLGLSLCGAALFAAYLVFDIQLLMGGQHQHKVSPDEYVLATIQIYLDIVNLFLYILRVLAERRD